MTEPALQALIHVLRTAPPCPGKIAFFGARWDAGLEGLGDLKAAYLQQYFKPYVDDLAARGLNTVATMPPEDDREKAAQAWLLLPRGREEAAHLMAAALRALAPGGRLVAAAANDAGGKTLLKTYGTFDAGLMQPNAQSFSKHKARVIIATPQQQDEAAIEQALRAGELRANAQTGFITAPGIFGWDKIDAGSALLASHLPETLAGRGADFGCGYGYLTNHVLRTCNGAAHMDAIDADARAVAACRENLRMFPGDQWQVQWADLSAPAAAREHYDFVVMNPPFHEGKKTDAALGQGFIRRAASSLRLGGTLWMVANTHLPYEQSLQSLFSSHRQVAAAQGFKVLHAVR